MKLQRRRWSLLSKTPRFVACAIPSRYISILTCLAALPITVKEHNLLEATVWPCRLGHSAGATIHYISTQQVNHPGPNQTYLAEFPSGTSATSWDGTGAVSFRLSTTMPTMNSDKQMSWPAQNEYKTASATVPKATPDGDYLLRVEHIALHMAFKVNKAQFYLSCSQITITRGENGSPGPLTSFPGAHKSTDSGFLVDLSKIAQAPQTYQPPGPAVWSG